MFGVNAHANLAFVLQQHRKRYSRAWPSMCLGFDGRQQGWRWRLGRRKCLPDIVAFFITVVAAVKTITTMTITETTGWFFALAISESVRVTSLESCDFDCLLISNQTEPPRDRCSRFGSDLKFYNCPSIRHGRVMTIFPTTDDKLMPHHDLIAEHS